MRPLWTAEELRAATGGVCPDGLAVTGIGLDTRGIEAGELFVALTAARDGHEWVRQAFARAASAMVTRAIPGGDCLVVSDTLAALTALGAAGRARSKARVIAVTGSVGKTTVKEMLRRACGPLGPTHASTASHNNHWGVPLTLARTPLHAEWAAIEIGMNHRGEIAPLARLARPHVAIVTAIGTAHIGNLGSEEAIAEEKADITAGLAVGGIVAGPRQGIAILPQDSRHFSRMAAIAEANGATVRGFGTHVEAQARLLRWSGTAQGGQAEYSIGGRQLTVALAQPGQHMALNALATLAAIHAAGGDAALAAAALEGFGAGAGRGQMRRIATADGGTATLLDESYNASDSALRAALAVLAAQKTGRRIAVLGDMLEMGEFGPALHAGLAPDTAAAADLVFACGPLMGHLFAALPEERRGAAMPDAATLAPLVRAALRDGDAVLVKGSLGIGMAAIIHALEAAEETSV